MFIDDEYPAQLLNSCWRCGETHNERLIAMSELVGCIMSTRRYCKPCHAAVLQERQQIREELEKSCFDCGKVFDPPLKLTRKDRRRRGYGNFGGFLCAECLTKKSSEVPEIESFWG